MALIESILSDAQLETLRDGYDRAAMNAGAKYSLATNRFPLAAPLVDGTLGTYFPEQPDEVDDADWRFFPVHVRDAAAKAADKGFPGEDGQVVPLQLDMAARELVLIPVLAATATPFETATHIYWGLMEGLTPRAIANSLLLIGYYRGVSTWSNAGSILEGTLTLLAAQADAGAATSTDIVVALGQKYG